MRDFIEAVKGKTTLDWPYLYAALDALKEERFEDVEQFCEVGLSTSRRAAVRGRLLEWLAIAAAVLGRPAEQVTALFDQAMAELPLDLTIRGNAKKFKQAIETKRAVPASEYELVKEIDEAEARKSLGLAA